MPTADHFLTVVRQKMAAANLPCSLKEHSHASTLTHAAITYRNDHVSISFTYEFAQWLLIGSVELWLKNVDPPHPYRGTNYVIGSFRIATLDDVPNHALEHAITPEPTIDYYVGLLQSRGQEIICGDFSKVKNLG